MLKVIAIVVVVAVAVFLSYVAAKPDEFRIARSQEITRAMLVK